MNPGKANTSDKAASSTDSSVWTRAITSRSNWPDKVCLMLSWMNLFRGCRPRICVKRLLGFIFELGITLLRNGRYSERFVGYESDNLYVNLIINQFDTGVLYLIWFLIGRKQNCFLMGFYVTKLHISVQFDENLHLCRFYLLKKDV